MGAVSCGPNLGHERREGSGLASGQGVSPGAQVEEPHVEVATLSGELAEPLEFRGKGGNRLRRQDSLELAEGRSGAAGGDPQIVERLGAAVGDGAADRTAKSDEKLRQDDADCFSCGLVGIEVQLQLLFRLCLADAGDVGQLGSCHVLCPPW